MFSHKKAIFWDNDGVLVDTEKYYFEATRQIMAVEGFNLTRELFIELFLVQAIGAWHLLNSKIYSSDDIMKLKKKRDELYNQLILSEDLVIDGVENLLQVFSKKYRMAIVTSSKPEHFKAIHERTGLLRYFDFCITAGLYSNYKPHPEPYLMAIQKMDIQPEVCIAIEDSRRGLLSAKAAKLDCIIVKNNLTLTSDFTGAELVIENIRQLIHWL